MKSLLNRLKGTFPVRLVMAYGQSNASNFAAALAFNAFLSMFPLILGILSVVGLVIQDPATETQIRSSIVGIFPADAHQQLLRALDGVKHSAGLLGIISLAGMLWSGSSLFGSMEFALTQIFGTKQRDTIRQRAMGVVMMILFVVAIVVAVGANAMAAALPLMPFAGILIGTAVLVALLIAIYRFVPNRTFSLGEVWRGAVLGGVLIEALTLAFPLYARVSRGFNTYGQQFALFFLLAAWLFLLSQLLLLGAVWNKMRVGTPDEKGIIAAPEADSKSVEQRPAAAIDRQAGPERKPELQPRTQPAPRSERPRRGPLKRALAAIGGRLRRRRISPG